MYISLLRTLILYLFIIIAMRLMGKRQIGELEPPELVITILLSELAAIPMQDSSIPLVAGLVPMVALIALELFTSFVCLKSRTVRRLVNGRAAIVIREGVLDRAKLADLRITTDEMIEALRQRDILDIADVKYGIIEANGQLSCILTAQAQPITAQMMDCAPAPSGLPRIVISDGQAISANIKQLGLTVAAIEKQVHAQNIASIAHVFLMTLDEYGNQFLQAKEGA